MPKQLSGKVGSGKLALVLPELVQMVTFTFFMFSVFLKFLE